MKRFPSLIQSVLRHALHSALRRRRPEAVTGAGEGGAAHPLRPQLRRQELPAHQDLLGRFGKMTVKWKFIVKAQLILGVPNAFEFLDDQ